MKWRELYKAFTPEERDQLIQLILQRIESLQAHPESLRLAKGQPGDERLKIPTWAYFICAHRDLDRATQSLHRSLFVYILGIVSFTVI